MAHLLDSVKIFARLPPAERQRLAAASSERRLAKGETLFREGQLSDAVWVVKTGRVHLTKFLHSGKASTTCVMTDGEPFCCLPALDQKAYPADAVAAKDTVVIRVPMAAFHQALQRSPAFTRDTLCLFCDRLRQVEHKGCMLYEPVEARLAQVLLALSKKFGPTIPLTRQELAELAGTTHESAIRALSQFKQQGLISSARGHTTLLKPDGLRALLA